MRKYKILPLAAFLPILAALLALGRYGAPVMQASQGIIGEIYKLIEGFVHLFAPSSAATTSIPVQTTVCNLPMIPAGCNWVSTANATAPCAGYVSCTNSTGQPNSTAANASLNSTANATSNATLANGTSSSETSANATASVAANNTATDTTTQSTTTVRYMYMCTASSINYICASPSFNALSGTMSVSIGQLTAAAWSNASAVYVPHGVEVNESVLGSLFSQRSSVYIGNLTSSISNVSVHITRTSNSTSISGYLWVRYYVAGNATAQYVNMANMSLST
ncbi:MAG: hypothetical protein ACREBH_04575 [Candidatus Micrarchaeaceae archaeon]